MPFENEKKKPENVLLEHQENDNDLYWIAFINSLKMTYSCATSLTEKELV